MKKKATEFVTREEANKKLFLTGMALGFDLGGMSQRVAQKLKGKKDPGEVAAIIEREIDEIFRRAKEEV
jgi:hypothetical protein